MAVNIKRRSIALSIILTFITFGIYGLFWAYFMGREAISACDENDSGTLEIVLMILVPFVGFFLMERRFYQAHQHLGLRYKKDNSILYLVLGLIGLSIVDFGMFQNDLNKLHDELELGLEFSYAEESTGVFDSTPRKNVTPKRPAIDPMEAIRKLAELKNEGIITEEEFAEKKQKYLDLI